MLSFFLLVAPKPVNSNEFNDLLDAQGFVKSNAPPDPAKSSLKSLRDQLDDQNDCGDPIKRKVRQLSSFIQGYIVWRFLASLARFREIKYLRM